LSAADPRAGRACQKDLIEANAVYRNGDREAMANAEAVVQAHIASQSDLMGVPPAERQAAWHRTSIRVESLIRRVRIGF
jgi:hypothetical protein